MIKDELIDAYNARVDYNDVDFNILNVIGTNHLSSFQRQQQTKDEYMNNMLGITTSKSQLDKWIQNQIKALIEIQGEWESRLNAWAGG